MRNSSDRVVRGTLLELGFTVVCAGAMTALAGLAGAGCDSDYGTTVIPPEDSGRTLTEAGPDPDPADRCPSAAPVDLAKLAWKPPTTPQSGRCQEDDLLAMREFLTANPTASNEDFEAFVKNRDTLCHECVFGDANAATWPPAPLQDGKVLTFNVGACYAIVTGRESCGKAIQNAWDCEFEACSDCASPGEVEPCRVKARAGACKAPYDASRLECAPISGDEQCGSPFDSIRAQCMATTADGGKP